jgi:hypothetical protein
MDALTLSRHLVSHEVACGNRSHVGYLCIVECYVSKLMLRPNRAYNSTFNSFCSSLMVLSFSSNATTSSSIFAVDVESISWTSGRGNETNESPILYLAKVNGPLCRCTEGSMQRTESCHPHPPAPTHLIRRRGPLSPSVASIQLDTACGHV